MVAGIDYGSRLSGKTVVAFLHDNLEVRFHSTLKGEDADLSVMQVMKLFPVAVVCIDAPLSLPGVYGGLPGFSDYFFRQCDRITGAMSPMFLGGLTARAMKLRSSLEDTDVKVYEAYPGFMARNMNLGALGYKREKTFLEKCIHLVGDQFHGVIDRGEVVSWHHFDALLALVAASKIANGTAVAIGDPNEGLIYH